MILAGTKNVEFRKKLPTTYDKCRYYLVCESQVHGVVYAAKQLYPITDIYKQPDFKPGISQDELEKYAGKEHVWVLRLDELHVAPIRRHINHFGLKRAPQNYCYEPDNTTNDSNN